MKQPTALAVALSYLRRGWAPVPVKPRGKRPLPEAWQNLRLTDADLQQHFGERALNVGVILGDASGGLCDVDLDSSEALRLAPQFLPPTGSIFGRPTKPRSHWIYKVHGAQRTEQFGDTDRRMLVELRGNGGQTVFPGSIHESGERIEWAINGDPAAVSHADLTQAVRKLAAASLLARHWPPQGGRHEAALAMAGWLGRSGWIEPEVITFVCAVANAAGDEEADRRAADIKSTFRRMNRGDTVTGVRRFTEIVDAGSVRLAAGWLGLSLESSGSQPSSQSRYVHRGRSYVPFPVETLPEPLRTFVLEHSRSLVCDPAYLAVPMLGVLAAAIGNSRVVRLKSGWKEPAIIWSAVVATSGALKSPALDAVTAPVRDLERRGLREFRDAITEWKRRKSEYRRDLKDFNSGERDAPPDEPESPSPKRFMCEDTTIEGLAVVLCDNEHGVVIIRDELSGWLRSFNQYRGGRGGDEARWLSIHGGRSITIDRKTGGQKYIHIPRAMISIVGCIQPGVLGSCLSEDHMQSGMAARLLFAYPPKRAKQWTDAVATEGTKDDYSRVVEKLHGLVPRTGEDGSSEPEELGLTPEALTAWIAFFNEQAAEQIAMTGSVAAAWSKLEGYAARIALVLHCVRQVQADKACSVEVDITSINAGIELSRWFGNEALRVYEMLQGDARDRDLNERLDVVLALGGRVSVRDWHRKRKARNALAARQELEELVRADLGRWERPAPSSQGGRPQELFVARAGDNTSVDEDYEGDSSPPHVVPGHHEAPSEASEERAPIPGAGHPAASPLKSDASRSDGGAP